MRFEGKIGRPAAALLLVWLLAGGAARAQLAIAGAAIFEQGVGGFPDDAEPADAMGLALATGDFDGDGRDDLAIASPGETVFAGADGAGQVTVVYGSATGLNPGSGVLWALDGTAHGEGQWGDALGAALAVGDFDDDGFDDLALGIPNRNDPDSGGAVWDSGAVLVLYGGASGLSAVGSELWRQGVAGVDGIPETEDFFGAALAAGDFNQDGFADLAVGVPGEDVGAILDSGAVNVLYGTVSGLSPDFATIADQIWVQGDLGLSLEETGDGFGASLAAGDFDGDGRDDLAVGAPREDLGAIADAGAVSVLYGSGLGLAATGARFVTQNDAVPAEAEADDGFGSALVAADFDGDGFDDLAAGAPGDSAGGADDAGVVNVFVNQGLFRAGFERGDAARWSDAVAN